MKLLRFVALAMLAACGSVGAPPGTASDAGGGSVSDAPIAAPGQLTISGSVDDLSIGEATSVAGVTLSAFAASNENTPLATATSDAQGAYTLTFMTNGIAFDGFIKASKSGLVDAYFYPSGPLTANFPGAVVTVTDSNTFGELSLFGETSANAVIFVETVDATGQIVAGVAVSSSPTAGIIDYTDSNGVPGSGSGTQSDGIAYLLNVPPGPVTISATKPGATFKSHGVTARVNALTTTQISE